MKKTSEELQAIILDNPEKELPAHVSAQEAFSAINWLHEGEAGATYLHLVDNGYSLDAACRLTECYHSSVISYAQVHGKV